MEKPQLYIANHDLTMWTWFLARIDKRYPPGVPEEMSQTRYVWIVAGGLRRNIAAGLTINETRLVNFSAYRVVE